MEDFENAFESFIDTAPKKTRDIIENIQYYYECYDRAKRKQEMQESGLKTGEGVEFVLKLEIT